MNAILVSIPIIGAIVGVMFWMFFANEMRVSRKNIELKTDATDRMARLAHHLDTHLRQPSQRA